MLFSGNEAYKSAVHLSRSDIAVDNPSAPTVMCVSIKQSKTDPFHKGVYLFLGRTATGLCPMAALLNYLVVRGSEPGALFWYKDGQCLFRQRFVETVKAALQQAGVEHAKYNRHSFRIGATTIAATRGIEDLIIKTQRDGGAWHTCIMCKYQEAS